MATKFNYNKNIFTSIIPKNLNRTDLREYSKLLPSQVIDKANITNEIPCIEGILNTTTIVIDIENKDGKASGYGIGISKFNEFLYSINVQETLESLLKKTYSVKTKSGGYHLYFKVMNKDLITESNNNLTKYKEYFEVKTNSITMAGSIVYMDKNETTTGCYSIVDEELTEVMSIPYSLYEAISLTPEEFEKKGEAKEENINNIMPELLTHFLKDSNPKIEIEFPVGGIWSYDFECFKCGSQKMHTSKSFVKCWSCDFKANYYGLTADRLELDSQNDKRAIMEYLVKEGFKEKKTNKVNGNNNNFQLLYEILDGKHEIEIYTLASSDTAIYLKYPNSSVPFKVSISTLKKHLFDIMFKIDQDNGMSRDDISKVVSTYSFKSIIGSTFDPAKISNRIIKGEEEEELDLYYNDYKPSYAMSNYKKPNKTTSFPHIEAQLKHFTGNEDGSYNEDQYNWLINYMATKFQKPEARAKVIFGVLSNQSAGKGLFARLLRAIFGKMVMQSLATIIKSDFNGMMKNKLFLVFEEFVKLDDENMGYLKDLSGGSKTLRINEKGSEAREYPNYVFPIIFSNNFDLLKINSSDSRFTLFSPRVYKNHEFIISNDTVYKGDDFGLKMTEFYDNLDNDISGCEESNELLAFCKFLSTVQLTPIRVLKTNFREETINESKTKDIVFIEDVLKYGFATALENSNTSAKIEGAKCFYYFENDKLYMSRTYFTQLMKNITKTDITQSHYNKFRDILGFEVMDKTMRKTINGERDRLVCFTLPVIEDEIPCN